MNQMLHIVNICLFNLYKSKTCIFWTQGRIQAHTPLKLEKIRFFGIKSWFFTRNTPTNFTPPSVRRNFFKCVPPKWNPGSAPGTQKLFSRSFGLDRFHCINDLSPKADKMEAVQKISPHNEAIYTINTTELPYNSWNGSNIVR